ncbi:MAG TPA: NifB/NifX family molybdenum-iron cluster-binding protein [Spirochaetota bacterium]|nr:dinitrogenase iron-molybdenum cofactor biosynthesis protein [Spirochaetota bacterium]HQO41087.1 NifB/NifX family molybdenum-iron cluster-binding protein [Spirochaetota bacterium]
MKIAVSSEGQYLSSTVDPRFGRARGFVVYDTESKDFTYVDNKQNLESAQGAGIQSAVTVIDTGASAVITGNVGPKAYSTLSQGGVSIYLCSGCTVGEAVDKLQRNELETCNDANVEGHW